MVYTAASPGLVVLDVLVHLALPARTGPRRHDVPDDVVLDRLAEPPEDAEAGRRAGDAFLDSGNALGLQVRSVVVPQETNLLLDTRHADMARVRIVAREPFAFDPRLLA